MESFIEYLFYTEKTTIIGKAPKTTFSRKLPQVVLVSFKLQQVLQCEPYAHQCMIQM